LESPPENRVRHQFYYCRQRSCPLLKAEQMPDIPLDVYKLCTFAKSRRFELVYVSLSTFFGKVPSSLPAILTEESCFSDIMTFSVIIYVSFGVGFSLRGDGPSILRTVVRDATVYFFGIFVINVGSLVDLLLKEVSSIIFLGSLNGN
jgi:hypothetical protein